jgi:hypothetical protein
VVEANAVGEGVREVGADAVVEVCTVTRKAKPPAGELSFEGDLRIRAALLLPAKVNQMFVDKGADFLDPRPVGCPVREVKKAVSVARAQDVDGVAGGRANVIFDEHGAVLAVCEVGWADDGFAKAMEGANINLGRQVGGVGGPEIANGCEEDAVPSSTSEVDIGHATPVEVDNHAPGNVVDFVKDIKRDHEKLGEEGEEGNEEDVENDDALRGGTEGEGRGVEEDAILELRKGDRKHVGGGDSGTKKDPEVLVAIGELDKGPGGGGDDGTVRRADGADVKDLGFVVVDAKTREEGEVDDVGHSRRKEAEIGACIESKVVSTGEGGEAGSVGDDADEGVVAEDKEEGREGATLFYPPVDGDGIASGATREKRKGAGKMKERLGEDDGPLGDADFAEDGNNIPVVDGVKGFGGVEEEDEVLLAAGEGLGAGVEGMVEVPDVVREVAAPKEAFLRGMDKIANRPHEDIGQDCRQDTVIEVVDSDGPHLVDEVGVILGDKVEKADIEARRNGAFGEVEEEAVEDGGGDVGEEAVGCGGDAVDAS